MSNSISHKISIRLSDNAYQEYKRLVETSPSNPHESVGQMIKWVAEWYPFRHSTRKYRKKIMP